MSRQYSMRIDASSPLPRLGAPARRVTKDRVVRPFDWGLDWIPRERPSAGRAPADAIARLGVAGDGGHRRVLHAAADDRLHADARDADGDLLTFPSALDDAAPREQHGLLPVFSDARDRRERASATASRATRAAVLVLPQWNSDAGRPRRSVQAAGVERHERAAPEPAVSRPAHAARAAPRRLHRQRERRADACRSAGRRCSTRGARSRGWRQQGYERIGILGTSLGSCLALLTAAHEPLIRARGAQPHLAVFRRRRVARPVDAARARRARTATSSSTCCDAVEADQPALVSRSAARPADAARLRALRPDLSRRSVGGSRAASSATAACRTRSPCCAAATTAPGRRRSSSSTAGC